SRTPRERRGGGIAKDCRAPRYHQRTLTRPHMTFATCRTSAAIVVAVLALASAPSLPAPSPSRTESAVPAPEAERPAAVVKTHVATLTDLLGDDLSYIHSSGVTDTKSSFIGLLKSGDLKYRSISESDVKARVYGDLVLLTGKAVMVSKRVNQDEATHNLYFTS